MGGTGTAKAAEKERLGLEGREGIIRNLGGIKSGTLGLALGLVVGGSGTVTVLAVTTTATTATTSATTTTATAALLATSVSIDDLENGSSVDNAGSLGGDGLSLLLLDGLSGLILLAGKSVKSLQSRGIDGTLLNLAELLGEGLALLLTVLGVNVKSEGGGLHHKAKVEKNPERTRKKHISRKKKWKRKERERSRGVCIQEPH
jgi:hypothetical protein